MLKINAREITKLHCLVIKISRGLVCACFLDSTATGIKLKEQLRLFRLNENRSFLRQAAVKCHVVLLVCVGMNETVMFRK
jgi:hypothetical protein